MCTVKWSCILIKIEGLLCSDLAVFVYQLACLSSRFKRRGLRIRFVRNSGLKPQHS